MIRRPIAASPRDHAARWCLGVLLLILLLQTPPSVSERLRTVSNACLYPFARVLPFAALTSGFVLKPPAGGSLATAGGGAAAPAHELIALRHELRCLRHVEDENRFLKELNRLRARDPQRLRPAEIVARDDIGGWWRTVRLDIGAEAGVAPGMPVISAAGLIGRVIAAPAGSAEVLLITDPTFRASVRLSRTNAVGVLKGAHVAADGTCELNLTASPRTSELTFVGTDAAVRVGDMAVTSGFGGVFPEGLFVGPVTGIEQDRSGLYQRVRVGLPADIATLRFVAVVMTGSTKVRNTVQSAGQFKH